jgi:DNA-binding CsgD family transcriptional regulator
MTAITISPRERQIWGLIVSGLLKKEVAATINRSEHTVSNTMRRLYAKLGITKETDLVREYFVYMGFVTADELRKTISAANIGLIALFLSLSAIQAFSGHDARPVRTVRTASRATSRTSSRKNTYYA